MSAWTPDNNITVGGVTVVTTSNGGHPPEYFAERIVDRLMFIGDEAPEPIKAQAYAFREKMLAIVLYGIKRAVQDDRNYRR